MAGSPLAEAYADLRLSDGKFTSDLVKIVSRLKLAVAQMESIAKVDFSATGNIRLNMGTAQAQVAQLRNDLTALGQIQTQLDVRETRIEEAKVEVQNLRTLIQGLNDDKIIVDPVVAGQEATAALSRIQLLIAEVTGTPAVIDFDVNSAEAMVKVEELSVAVDSLDSETVDIHVTTSGVTKAKTEVEQLNAAAATAASDRGGLSNFEKRLILFGSTAALAGIFKLGESITKFGLDTSAQLESIEVSFANILQSTQVASQVFDELKAFSVPAPFDTVVLAGVAKQLLAIGDSATQAIPDVKTLAGVVTLFANSDPNAFGRLTLALGQIGSSTRPLAPDLRQITQAIPGFNAQLELAAGVARKFGIETDEAEQMIADGAIGGAEGMRILLDQMKRFPGAATAISTQAETLQGKLSQFRDTVKLNLSDAFAGLANELTGALGPLSDSVDVAFKAIGPELAQSLSTVLPTLGPLIEQLGTAFAPALGGFATGLATTLDGLLPTLQVLLPTLGKTFELFGQFTQTVGPALGQTAGILADLLIPALQLFNDVLGAIPVPVLSALLTTLLGFRALTFLKGTFEGFELSMQRAAAKGTDLEESVGRLKKPTGDFAKEARIATAAAAGFFSGLALGADDAATKITGLVGSIGAIAGGFATGGVPGGLFAAATTGIGFLVSSFENGKRKAEEFKKSVEELASAIRANLKLTPEDIPTLDLSKIIHADDFQKEVEKAFGPDLRKRITDQLGGTLTSGDLENAVSDKANGLGTLLSKALGTSIKVDPKLISDIITTSVTQDESPELLHRIAAAAGFDPEQMSEVAREGAEGVRKTLTAILGVPVTADPLLLNEIILAFEQLQKVGGATLDQVNSDLVFFQKQLEHIDPQKAAADVTSFTNLLLDFDHASQEAAQAASALAPKISTAGLPFATASQDAAELNLQFEAMVSGLETLNPLFEQFGASLSIEAALENVKDAAEGVKDTFDDLMGSLSASIAQQKLQFELNNLGKSLQGLVGADEFKAAQARAESLNEQIESQTERLADLRSDLETAQRKAVIDAADFDRRIAEAEKFGSVTGLAALRAARAQVDADVADKQSDLDRAQEKIGELQEQLAGLDFTTPQKLIDIVKGQAKAAGVDLWQFLLTGPTEEAQQLYQETLGSVVQQAFQNIQTVDATQGPEAAKNLVSSIQSSLHDQLIAGGFSPGTADEIVQNMLKPDELQASLAEELSANVAAATAAASAAGPKVNVGLNTDDITKSLEDLQKFLTDAPPVRIKAAIIPDVDAQTAATNTAVQALAGVLLPAGAGEVAPLDFADLDKQLATHEASIVVEPVPDFADTDRLLFEHVAPLGAQVDPDFADSDQRMAVHNALLTAVVAPDFADSDKQLALHVGVTTALVAPDTTLLDQNLAQQRFVTVQVQQDPNQIFQFNARPGAGVLQADGGVLQFFRQGGIAHPMRDSAHVAQIAPAGAWRVWAEPETGGEGYVPLALSKRERSTEVVRVIADMFGFRLEPKVTVNPTVAVSPDVTLMSTLAGPSVTVHPTPAVPANVTVNVPSAEQAHPTIHLVSLMPSLSQPPAVRLPDRPTTPLHEPAVVQFDPKVLIGPTSLSGSTVLTATIVNLTAPIVNLSLPSADSSSDRAVFRDSVTREAVIRASADRFVTRDHSSASELRLSPALNVVLTPNIVVNPASVASLYAPQGVFLAPQAVAGWSSVVNLAVRPSGGLTVLPAGLSVAPGGVSVLPGGLAERFVALSGPQIAPVADSRFVNYESRSVLSNLTSNLSNTTSNASNSAVNAVSAVKEAVSSAVSFVNAISTVLGGDRTVIIHPAASGSAFSFVLPAPSAVRSLVSYNRPAVGHMPPPATYTLTPVSYARTPVSYVRDAVLSAASAYVNVDPKVMVGPTSFNAPSTASATVTMLDRVREFATDRTLVDSFDRAFTDRADRTFTEHLDRTVAESMSRTLERTSTYVSTLNQQSRFTVGQSPTLNPQFTVRQLMPPAPNIEFIGADEKMVDATYMPLPGNTQVKVTASLDDDRIVASLDRLVDVLTSPSSYTDRRARAEATGAVARLAEAILGLEKTRSAAPRRQGSLRDIADELTRMSR